MDSSLHPPIARDKGAKRKRILHEAERLFALHGYEGTSMRDIANAAKVPLSLIVYHFKTKLKLYRCLFENRRAIFEARLTALHTVTDFEAPDAIEKIIAAFVLPVLSIQNTEEGRYYSLLSIREASDFKEGSRGILRDYFDPMAREFIQSLQKALPNTPRAYIHWAYLFAVGALLMNSFDERMERLSDGMCHPQDVSQKSDFLVSFISAGFRAKLLEYTPRDKMTPRAELDTLAPS